MITKNPNILSLQENIIKGGEIIQSFLSRVERQKACKTVYFAKPYFFRDIENKMQERASYSDF